MPENRPQQIDGPPADDERGQPHHHARLLRVSHRQGHLHRVHVHLVRGRCKYSHLAVPVESQYAVTLRSGQARAISPPSSSHVNNRRGFWKHSVCDVVMVRPVFNSNIYLQNIWVVPAVVYLNSQFKICRYAYYESLPNKYP